MAGFCENDMIGFRTYGIPYHIAVLDTSPWGMANMQWNLSMEKLKYNASLWDTSYVDMVSAQLLNPGFALQQAINNYNFNNGTFGCNWCPSPIGWNGYIGGFNGGFNSGTLPTVNYNATTPQFPWLGGGGNAGGGTGASTEEKELKTYKDLFKKMKDKGCFDEETIKAYNEALKKGSAAEKLEAVKNVFIGIDKKNIKSAILDDDEIQKGLLESGYYFGISSDNDRIDINEQIKNKLAELSTGKSCETFTLLASLFNENNAFIIQAISKWNETHNDENSRGIIRFVANNLQEADYKPGIQNFVTALKKQAGKYEKSSAITAKVNALDKAYNDVSKIFNDLEASNNKYSSNYKSRLQNALLRLAPTVDALYAQIRMQQAAEVDNKIQEKYGSVMQATGVNDINIQDATKKDLKNEGIIAGNADVIKSQSRYSKSNEKEGADGVEGENENKNNGDNVDKQALEETGKKIRNLVDEGKLIRIVGRPGYYTDKYNNLYRFNKDNTFVKFNGKIYSNGDIEQNGEKRHCTKIDSNDSAWCELIDPDTFDSEKYNPDNIPEEEEESTKVTPLSGSERTNMVTLAAKNNLKETKVTGYYYKENGKGKTYYKYNNGKFEPLRGIKEITDEGIAKLSNGGEKAIRPLSSAKSQGARLRELLHGYTDSYTEITRIMNAFSTYTDPQDIIDFIKGYNDEKSVLISWNDRLCAQISTENNLKGKKNGFLKIIANKILIVMNELGIDPDDKGYKNMTQIAELDSSTPPDSKDWELDVPRSRWLGFKKSWTLWYTSRTGAANRMDDVIDDVLEKWEKNKE